MAKATATNGSKPLTKTQVFTAIAEATELNKKQVAAVFDAIAAEIKKALGKKGPGIFTIPGLMKVKRKERKALPARPGRNPKTGETVMLPARKASMTVGVRPLKSLKEMVQ